MTLNKFNIILILLLSSTVASLSAQKLNGYVITKDNDTLRGKLKNNNLFFFPQNSITEVWFYDIPGKKKVLYSPDMLTGFSFTKGKKNYRYESKKVQISKNTFPIKHLFVQVLTKGSADLYKFRVPVSYSSVIPDPGPPSFIPPTRTVLKTIFVIEKPDGHQYYIRGTEFKEELREAFSDFEGLSDFLKNNIFSSRKAKLIAVTESYNQWYDEQFTYFSE